MNDLTSNKVFLGLSHSPLLGMNELSADDDIALGAALSDVRKKILVWAPELIVLVAPDHYNGFFHDLMPPFCIGTQATAIGDYGTPSGPLRVDEQAATGLAAHLNSHGIDMAVSRRMRVDHGFVQSLELIWGGLDTPPIIPIFLNALAAPAVPSAKRCLTLGSEAGAYTSTLGKRVLFLSSGGLSHEPPMPSLSDPDPAVRAKIMTYSEQSPHERSARVERAKAAGLALASGDPRLKPLNPDWDKQWMDAFEHGRLEKLAELSDADITAQAGGAAHESKTWLVGRAALRHLTTRTALRFYRQLPQLIAGFGILLQEPSTIDTEP